MEYNTSKIDLHTSTGGDQVMDAFSYTFPAIRGIQASKEYYVLLCPLKLLPKIFLFDEEELKPELRAQRIINKARIPEIASYIESNPKNYIFSALTASVDAEAFFTPASETLYNIGSLTLPMSAKFIINDGQHRRAAIEVALKKRPDLGDETIPIVLFIDLGLKKSQQMFSDLNRYAIRTTKSLSILYDNRDPWAVLVKETIDEISFFKGLVETEKSTISNRSRKIFTLSGIYSATKELFGEPSEPPTEADRELSKQFWHELWLNSKEWQQVRNKELTAAELRRDYINAHSIALMGLGKAGKDLVSYYPHKWKDQLKKINTINWHRDNTSVWEGRVTFNGKISNSRNNLTLLTTYIKSILELPINTEESTPESIIKTTVGA